MPAPKVDSLIERRGRIVARITSSSPRDIGDQGGKAEGTRNLSRETVPQAPDKFIEKKTCNTKNI